MASGYEVNGVDFDDIFEPRTTTKRANVGFQINGSDISNLYEKSSSGTPASNIGYQVSGSDIGPLFAAKGGVVYWDGKLSDLGPAYSDIGSNPQREAIVEFLFQPDGRILLRKNYPFGETQIGRWDGEKANSSNTEIQIVVLSGSLHQNPAPNMVPLSVMRAFGVNASGIVNPPNESNSQTAQVEIRLQQTNTPASRITRVINLSAIHYGGDDSTGPIV